MCELFAISSSKPASVNYSMHEFAKHGGLTYSNKSGWGISFYDGPDALLIKEPQPASNSEWVKFIAKQNIKSTCIIAHIRKATVGEPALHNTHPFRRSLGRRTHTFAHNGTLNDFRPVYPRRYLTRYPMGDTDSELAFCWLLARLEQVWETETSLPSIEARMEVFSGFAKDMSEFGSANFIYSDGDTLFVHAHKRKYEENGVFTEARPPGLSMLDCKVALSKPEFACNGLKINLADQETVLFASVPLSNEGWKPLPEGTAIAVKAGKEIMRVSTL